MRALCWFLAWEWINIAIEFTATAWVRFPRWFLAVVAVNLATHPAFTFVLARFGHSLQVVLPCEAVIVCAEALLLMAVYGFSRWRGVLFLSLLMNAASYFTGVLLTLQVNQGGM